jgi:putative NIF3 family GTP cyclohydrolase 1 type 2
MVNLHELVKYSDALLQCGLFKDYCPNGLQVEGKAEVMSIVAGVTASQALIDAAVCITVSSGAVSKKSSRE